MLTSPDVQETLDSAILAGDDDKVGGLVPESTDLLGLKIALEDFEDSTKSQEASNDPDSVDQAQDSAETRMASDADGQDGVRIFQGSTETEGTSILFDDIEVWFDPGFNPFM